MEISVTLPFAKLSMSEAGTDYALFLAFSLGWILIAFLYQGFSGLISTAGSLAS
jgi:hypothetical protein